MLNNKHLRAVASVGLSAGLLMSGPVLAADLVIETDAPSATETAGSWYVSLFTGGVWSDGEATLAPSSGPDFGVTAGTNPDMGYTLGLAVGTEVFEHLRGEVELSVIQSKVSSFLDEDLESELTSTGINLLGNLWYDIETGNGFTPYVGGGLGVGYTELTSDMSDVTINATGIVYQLGAGVQVAMTDQLALDLGYRYKVMPDAAVSGDLVSPGTDITVDATSHVVQAGLTFRFD